MNSNLQKVGVVTCWSKGRLEFYWNPDTRQVHVFEAIRISRFFQQDDWYVADKIWHVPQNDGNIIERVALYLGCPSHYLCADQIMVFDKTERHGKAADDQLFKDIYDCEWSDFACENLVIHFNVRNDEWMKDKYERLATALEWDNWYPGYPIDCEAIERNANKLRAEAGIQLSTCSDSCPCW